MRTVVFIIALLAALASPAFSLPSITQSEHSGKPDITHPNRKPPFPPKKFSGTDNKNKLRPSEKEDNQTEEDLDDDIPESEQKSGKPFFSYRGQRKPVESSEFYILALSTMCRDGKTVLLNITFSQGIDPRSISFENIKISDKTISPSSKISFNREGNKIRISFFDENLEFPFSLVLTGIQSYNGKNIEEFIFEDINSNDSYKFDKEALEWQKY